MFHSRRTMPDPSPNTTGPCKALLKASRTAGFEFFGEDEEHTLAGSGLFGEEVVNRFCLSQAATMATPFNGR